MERRLFEEEQSGEEVTARLKERTKELEEARYIGRKSFNFLTRMGDFT